jgi:hypothetical protein
LHFPSAATVHRKRKKIIGQWTKTARPVNPDRIGGVERECPHQGEVAALASGIPDGEFDWSLREESL